MVVLAAVVYRPWAAPALPLTDFGVFMPKMDPSQPLWSQYLSVAGYHITEGRLALVQYGYMVFARNAFGFDPAGWHWMYFVMNCLVLVLARALMLRTGASRSGAFAALALWAMMPPVAEGWIRPTGEPFALAFFLVAALMLVNYADRSDWKRRAGLAALCAVGVVLSKEILVLLLPAAWLVSRLRFGESGAEWVKWSERDSVLLLTVGTALATVLAGVAYVVSSASGGYSDSYGESFQSTRDIINRVEMILVPTTPRLGALAKVAVDPAWMLLLALPSLLWVRMFAAGAIVGRPGRIAWPLAIAAAWVVPGFLAYLPWTSSGEFYFTPFALGAMFAGAHAITRCMSHSASERRLAFATVALLVCITSVEARSTVYKFQLRAVLNDALVRDLSRSGGADLLVGAVPSPVPDARWWWASNLEGFVVAATAARIDRARDMSCGQAAEAVSGASRVVVVSREGACGRISPSSVPITAQVPRMQWPYLWESQILRDRVYVTRSPSAVTSAVGAMKASL